ncbi:MAG: hypothetical protein WBV63_10145 [Candidatus Sulfotelmatobacter sp.]
MKTRVAFGLLTILLLVSCSSTPRTSLATPTSRVYHGTASVGDFMTVTVNSGAQTIAYTDLSNGASGAVSYTVNSNGGYTLSDPTGNLVAAYEVPNYAMVIQATKTGPSANTLALVTAVESGQISLATFEGQAYNYMQFRTASGGVDVGSVNINAQGTGTTSSYWPFGALNSDNNTAFNSNALDMAAAVLDPSGTFLTIPDPGNSSIPNYVFGTPNGIFAVDTPNGAILGLKKAASASFDASSAGTYNAIYYEKTNANAGSGNTETGTPSQGSATITVTSGGQVTVSDASGNTMATGALVPVANVGYLYAGAGELNDPCNGLFTFQVSSNGAQQQVFVAFMGEAILFSSFSANLPWGSGGSYNYFYGVGLK